MLDVPYLADFLRSVKKNSVDDLADRLFYYTTLLFIFFAIVIGARSYTSPIECMMPQEFPGTWKSYVREYCYISGTYFVSSLAGMAIGEVPITQGYYQWVAYILVIKAFLLSVPNIAWKVFLHTQNIDYQHVVEKAKTLRFVMGEELQQGLKDITGYLKERLQYQGEKNGASIAGFGMKSSLFHTLAKVLTVFVIFFELYFMNTTFAPEYDTFWGITMINQGLSKETKWLDTGIFPRLTFCNFSQPILGGIGANRTVHCVLPQNMINEKIFIFVWLWLAALLILSIFNIFFVVFNYFLPSRRLKSTEYFVQLDMKDENDDEKVDATTKGKMIDFACDMFGPDGIYLLDCIKLNGGSLIATDIATQIVEELYVDTAPTNEYSLLPEKKDDEVQPPSPPADDE